MDDLFVLLKIGIKINKQVKKFMTKTRIILFAILLIFLQRSSISNKNTFPSNNDISEILIYRTNMDKLLDYMTNDEILAASVNNNTLLPTKYKERYRLIWGTFWHYLNRINTIKKEYRNFYSIKTDEVDPDLFLKYYFAQLTFQNYGIKLITIIEQHDDLKVILNEKFENIPYRENSYTNLKNQILQFRTPFLLSMNHSTYKSISKNDNKLNEIIKSDIEYISTSFYINNFHMSLKNTINNLDNDWSTLIYPAQRNISKLLGNVKIWRNNDVFITDSQIKELEQILEPCDIILQRREWVLTNLFIPGYWTHSALYIGTPDERVKYFKNDSLVNQWITDKNGNDFNNLLKSTYPSAYFSSTKLQNNNPPSVIESVEEGVTFNTLRQSAFCDGIVILRPKLSKIEKAHAIYNAYNYAGCPYDYNFNFLTDSSLICTELIYKSFESNEYGNGLSFNVNDVRNRKLFTANDMAKEFDNEYETNKNQFDFVVFYDVSEKNHMAILSNLDNFRNSWKRSKFYFLYDKLISPITDKINS